MSLIPNLWKITTKNDAQIRSFTTALGSCTEEELLAQGFAACLFKPFGLSELMAVSEKCLSASHIGNDKVDMPDLTFLLVYGDKAAMLDKLIAETEKNMQAVNNAGEP